MASLELDERAQEIERTPTAGPVRLAWDPAAGPTPLGFGWEAEPVVLDWYGDGRHDLLVSSGGGPNGRHARVFRRLSAPGEPAPRYDEGRAVPGLDGLRCLCPVRNSRGTRFDLVGLSRDGFVLLRNVGNAQEPAFQDRTPTGIPADLGVGPCRVVQAVAVDWDGDGLDDLLIGLDHLPDYWPDSDRLPESQQKGFNQKGGHPGYDQKGLWRGGTPVGRLFWVRNLGGDEGPVFETQPEIVGDTHPLDLGMHPAPLGVAWEHPGGLELLVTDRRGLLRVHRNFGDQRPPVLMEPRTLTCGGAPLLLPADRTVVVAADLDDDRRDELVYGTADGRVFAVHTGSGRKDLKNPQAVLRQGPELWLGGRAVVTAGDLDGDGGLDLLAGVASGHLLLLTDAGPTSRGQYNPPVVIESGGAPFVLDPGPDGMLEGPVLPRLGHAAPTLVDWTGHDRLDILVGGAGGEVVVLPNDGASNDPRFGHHVPLRCKGLPLLTPPRVRPAAADWTEDGQLDLIALNLQGFLCVYPRLGRYEVDAPLPLVDRLGRFLRLDGGFGLSGRCALWAGPWCGSGHQDILVGLPRANRHVVPAVTGVEYRDPEEIPTVLLLENLGHGVLCPRPLSFSDGRPVVLGSEGCSPSGVVSGDTEELDLLVGADDGSVAIYRRSELRW